jgi:hypothetical protein
MVTLLITAAAVFVLFGFAVYFWQKPATDNAVAALPPPPNPRGLFEESPTTLAEAERQTLLAERREDLIKSAQSGDRSALLDSKGDPDLYDRVLTELVEVSDSAPKLLSLLSYISQNDLPVNRRLAEAVLASWKENPDRGGTAKALHFAALSDDPDIFRTAVETALQLWRQARLKDTSAVELRALFEGEFWVLSSRSRSSGAGFVLKRTLDGARRELEAAAGALSINESGSANPETPLLKN